ncbi:MAG: hypothetical protein U1F66_04110 [bacterium]
MPTLDVKGFNQFQDEILVIDTNLNDEIDPKDEFIAVAVEGLPRGAKLDYHHPRFVELRRRYLAFLEAEAGPG